MLRRIWMSVCVCDEEIFFLSYRAATRLAGRSIRRMRNCMSIRPLFIIKLVSYITSLSLSLLHELAS
jgi:hypothetical protein